QRLRESVVDWFARRRGVPGLRTDQVLPTIGSKELVAYLPALLGLGEGDVVVHPRIAYPTYDVGTGQAGADVIGGGGDPRVDDDIALPQPEQCGQVGHPLRGAERGQHLGGTHARPATQVG